MTTFPVHKPKKIEFIQQKGKSDCGIACIAMLSGCMYELALTVFKALGKHIRGGIYPQDVFEVLEEFGLQDEEMKTLPKEGVALVAIQWKDKCFAGHYIVWDANRKQFLDPLHGVYGKTEFRKYATIDCIWKISRSE